MVQEIGMEIHYASRNGGALCSKQRLSITLHGLRSGSQYLIIGHMDGVHKSTVCISIKTVVNAVKRLLCNRIITWPENIGNVDELFYRIANFQNVCGVLDVSLIHYYVPEKRPNNIEFLVLIWVKTHNFSLQLSSRFPILQN